MMKKNLIHFIKSKFSDFIKLYKKSSLEVFASIEALDDCSQVIDSIASHLPLNVKESQALLETNDLQQRADGLIGYLQAYMDSADVDIAKVRNRVKKQMEKSQREYYPQ